MRKSELTAGWLTDSLRGRGFDDPVVRDLTVTPVGTGQVADSYRLVPVYESDPGTAPTSFVAKVTSEDEQSRTTGRDESNYLREVRYYQQLASTVSVRVPTCHVAEIDDSGIEFVLLLEDVGPAKQGDQMRGCTIDECRTVLEQAARLHGPRWEDSALRELPWLNFSKDYTPRLMEIIPMLFEGFRERYGDQLDPEDLKVGEGVIAALPAYYEAQRSMPWTVQHGDFRPDNMLFGACGDAEPLVIVDWQTAILGPGTLDVAYFLGGALSSDTRLAHEKSLVQHYHDELVRLGVDYSFEALWEDYRRLTLQGYIIGMGAAMVVKRTSRGDEMFLTMVRRAARQITELESLAALR